MDRAPTVESTRAEWDRIAPGYDRTNTPTQMRLASEGLHRAGARRGALGARRSVAAEPCLHELLDGDDGNGHSLPVRVAQTGPDPIPQLAQWAVLEHHLYGEGLPLDSDLLRGTMGMLEAAESQGLPHSIGWMKNGIWAGYGALYAHVPLLQGRHAKAADLMSWVGCRRSTLRRMPSRPWRR